MPSIKEVAFAAQSDEVIGAEVVADSPDWVEAWRKT
jgi:hypothetical protein